MINFGEISLTFLEKVGSSPEKNFVMRWKSAIRYQALVLTFLSQANLASQRTPAEVTSALLGEIYMTENISARDRGIFELIVDSLFEIHRADLAHMFDVKGPQSIELLIETGKSREGQFKLHPTKAFYQEKDTASLRDLVRISSETPEVRKLLYKGKIQKQDVYFLVAIYKTQEESFYRDLRIIGLEQLQEVAQEEKSKLSGKASDKNFEATYSEGGKNKLVLSGDQSKASIKKVISSEDGRSNVSIGATGTEADGGESVEAGIRHQTESGIGGDLKTKKNSEGETQYVGGIDLEGKAGKLRVDTNEKGESAFSASKQLGKTDVGLKVSNNGDSQSYQLNAKSKLTLNDKEFTVSAQTTVTGEQSVSVGGDVKTDLQKSSGTTIGIGILSQITEQDTLSSIKLNIDTKKFGGTSGVYAKAGQRGDGELDTEIGIHMKRPLPEADHAKSVMKKTYYYSHTKGRFDYYRLKKKFVCTPNRKGEYVLSIQRNYDKSENSLINRFIEDRTAIVSEYFPNTKASITLIEGCIQAKGE